MERMRITLTFSNKKDDDIELFNKLQKYSCPSSYIKDVLKGLLPGPNNFEIIINEGPQEIIENNQENYEDNEDIMNF